MILIQPLQDICSLVNDQDIESQLRSIPLEQQEEVYDMLKQLMTDEISFVLHLHQAIGCQKVVH